MAFHLNGFACGYLECQLLCKSSCTVNKQRASLRCELECVFSTWKVHYKNSHIGCTCKFSFHQGEDCWCQVLLSSWIFFILDSFSSASSLLPYLGMTKACLKSGDTNWKKRKLRFPEEVAKCHPKWSAWKVVFLRKLEVEHKQVRVCLISYNTQLAFSYNPQLKYLLV